MNMSDWEKLQELSYNFYDTIDFTSYFDDEDWVDIEVIIYKLETFYDNEHPELLPKELDGCFFSVIDPEEFTLYLKKRYNLEFSWQIIDKYYVKNPNKT